MGGWDLFPRMAPRKPDSMESIVKDTHNKSLDDLGRSVADFQEKIGNTAFKVAHRIKRASIPPWIRRHITFYRIHFLCFVIVDVIGTLILWLSPGGPLGQVSFVDALFTSTSALCVTGLIPVRMKVFSIFDQIVLVVLMFVGGQVFTSLVPVYVRRFYFREYLEAHPEEDPDPSQSDAIARATKQGLGSISETRGDLAVPVFELPQQQEQPKSPRPLMPSALSVDGGAVPHGANDEASLEEASPAAKSFRTPELRLAAALAAGDGPDHPESSATWAGDTAKQNGAELRAMMELMRLQSRKMREVGGPAHGLGGEEAHPGRGERHGRMLHWLFSEGGGSSAVHSSESESGDTEVDELEEEQPRTKRFVELSALRALSWLVPLYLFTCLSVAFCLLLIAIYASGYARDVLSANDVSPIFMAAFQSVSGFANAGLSLLDDNLVSFHNNVLYLLTTAALILLGNTMYAPCLRYVIFTIHRFLPSSSPYRPTFKYMLDHPRKCFTHLFPARQTMWLFLTVLAFNSVEFFFFVVLDWNSEALQGSTGGTKILDGFFQSISTRNAGFNVITLALLSPAMLVLYAGMMYLAVYPLYLTRQASREQREVYDDEDLGVFLEDVEGGVLDDSVLGQSKKLIGTDAALLFLSVFLVCIIQSHQIDMDGTNFSIFNIIFEVISAFGNVGLSLGYTCVPPGPGQTCDSPPYSFSGTWKTLSKLILVFVMLMGRHRGLPDNIDAAIAIPEPSAFQRRTAPVASKSQDPSADAGAEISPAVMMREMSKTLSRRSNATTRSRKDSLRSPGASMESRISGAV